MPETHDGRGIRDAGRVTVGAPMRLADRYVARGFPDGLVGVHEPLLPEMNQWHQHDHVRWQSPQKRLTARDRRIIRNRWGFLPGSCNTVPGPPDCSLLVSNRHCRASHVALRFSGARDRT
ncbi:MAG: hypothetical protein EBQ56_00575 [Proteobacteria bacterium]|nr:hypothetical protein [Actinomycetota bacterium]NBY46273.1 hypothetical protein [Pseudomonadota bacterium]